MRSSLRSSFRSSRRSTALALAALLGCAMASLPARAEYVTVAYGGTVSVVHAATSGPAGPADIALGTAVSFSATFDPSRLVDISQTVYNIDHLSGQPVPLPLLRAASLFDDPNASYTVTIGSHVFTSADDDLGGGDFGHGAGHFPLVIYNGSQLLGLDGEADVDGLVFDFDPMAKLLHYTSHVGNGYYDADGDFGFAVDTSLDAAIAAAPLAAVPEPSSWALLALGLAALAVVGRRKARSTSQAPRRARALSAGALAIAALSGCASGSMPNQALAAASPMCDSNADYAMTGVVHATTQRERDDCRRGR